MKPIPALRTTPPNRAGYERIDKVRLPPAVLNEDPYQHHIALKIGCCLEWPRQVQLQRQTEDEVSKAQPTV